MADEIKKVKIKDLPQTTSINDDDIFVESDSLETYKVTASDIAKYVSTNEILTDKYIAKTAIGATNGVAPLNSNKKINGTYITYGTTSNTAYEGSNGKTLETNLDNHLTDEDAHGYATRLDNMYTKSEVDNKFSSLETNIDWKESVSTFDDIATTYPNPVDGWTVNVKDTDYTYRYDGTEWILISANAIPNATSDVNGLMTSTDKIKLDGIAENANNYSLPSATDTTLGGVRVGNNITNTDGTLSLTKQNITDALGYTPGTSTGVISYTLEKDGSNIKLVGNDGSESSITDNDTKNTAGSTNNEDKLFIIGAKSQSSETQTYSRSTVYIDADGDLCSNDAKVSTIDHTHDEYVNIVYSDTEPTTQRVGDYWCQDYE